MIFAMRFDHLTWSKGDEPGLAKTGAKVRPWRVFVSAFLAASLADEGVDFVGFGGVAVAGGTDIFLGYWLIFGYMGVKLTLFRRHMNDHGINMWYDGEFNTPTYWCLSREKSKKVKYAHFRGFCAWSGVGEFV